MQPTRESFDANNYRYIETRDEWRAACRPLPCSRVLWWPDYATKVVEDTIDGKPVIIQLWKGWCPQFLALPNMPGGVGAEVGVYAKVPGRRIPDSVPGVPDSLLAFIRLKLAGLSDDELWWPYPDSELRTTIEFDFINPKSGDTVFHAGPETTYWITRWMDLPSYEKYVAAQPGIRGIDKKAPDVAWDYAMKYTINGRTFPVWEDHR